MVSTFTVHKTRPRPKETQVDQLDLALNVITLLGCKMDQKDLVEYIVFQMLESLSMFSEVIKDQSILDLLSSLESYVKIKELREPKTQHPSIKKISKTPAKIFAILVHNKDAIQYDLTALHAIRVVYLIDFLARGTAYLKSDIESATAIYDLRECYSNGNTHHSSFKKLPKLNKKNVGNYLTIVGSKLSLNLTLADAPTIKNAKVRTKQVKRPKNRTRIVTPAIRRKAQKDGNPDLLVAFEGELSKQFSKPKKDFLENEDYDPIEEDPIWTLETESLTLSSTDLNDKSSSPTSLSQVKNIANTRRSTRWIEQNFSISKVHNNTWNEIERAHFYDHLCKLLKNSDPSVKELGIIIGLCYFTSSNVPQVYEWEFSSKGNITKSYKYRRKIKPPENAFVPTDSARINYIDFSKSIDLPLPSVLSEQLEKVLTKPTGKPLVF